MSRNSFPVVRNLDHFMSEEFQVNLGKFQLGAIRERIFILPYKVLIYMGEKNAGELESVSDLTKHLSKRGGCLKMVPVMLERWAECRCFQTHFHVSLQTVSMLFSYMVLRGMSQKLISLSKAFPRLLILFRKKSTFLSLPFKVL